MTRQQIAKLFPSLNRSTTPAAQVDYQNTVSTITQTGVSALYETVVQASFLTWQGDTAATVLEKLKTHGDNAQTNLAFHAGAAQLLNSLFSQLNKSLPKEEQIPLLETELPGEIEWGKNGNAVSFTPHDILTQKK